LIEPYRSVRGMQRGKGKPFDLSHNRSESPGLIGGGEYTLSREEEGLYWMEPKTPWKKESINAVSKGKDPEKEKT